MKPLFEVGEEVILCSMHSPELNGDAVVLSVIKPPSAEVKCPHCGRGWLRRRREGIVYYLNIESIRTKDKCCSPWRESALRKKHKGSDFSFDEMIKEIKSTGKIKVKG